MDHSHFGRLSSTEFVFLFVEADAERFASLEREIAGFWSTRVGGQPKHVRVKLYNDQFVSVAEELVTYTREQKKQLAPTLAFIDPFGWSGVPLALIADCYRTRRLIATATFSVSVCAPYDGTTKGPDITHRRG